MAHTDREPGDNVFNDIKQAAIQTWVQQNFHRDYVEEKLEKIESIENYADNWYSFIGAFDRTNQMIFWHNLRLKGSAEFLKIHKGHYGYFVPREKE